MTKGTKTNKNIHAITNQEINARTPNLHEIASSSEGKIMEQIRHIHYNKIETIIFKFMPKLESTVN